ncbi:MAG: Gfo/Idh/MocA family oxidoreductase [Thermoguttaceae bacterium]|nr:Gfo/Idh/MocA family oxidoreductase [Thermoguttaceae bacterium]
MTNRRDFLKTAAVGAAAVSTLSIAQSAHAAGSDTLRVGLVGCGGRGRGALKNSLDADPNTVVTAFGDLFPETAQRTFDQYKNNPRCKATQDTVFSGFDSYKGVIENCDVVILATSPHYRPIQFAAAVEAGKHVFFEKPNGVDVPGILSFLETGKKAAEKGLTVVSGLHFRYDKRIVETMNRVLDGMIGDVREISCSYLTNRLWTRPRQPQDTEMMFQNRNWYNFTWLSGDYNVEQHVHTLDKANWIIGLPQSAWGMGARSVRVDQPAYGDIYDQMSVTFDYPNGVKVHSCCRQINGCFNEMQCRILGTKGHASAMEYKIIDLNGNVLWSFDRKARVNDGHLEEHIAMYDSIRNSKATNCVEYSSYSTIMAILGREACYTGQKLSWEQILNSKKVLAPSAYTPDAVPPCAPIEGATYAPVKNMYNVPLPGLTKFQ